MNPIGAASHLEAHADGDLARTPHVATLLSSANFDADAAPPFDRFLSPIAHLLDPFSSFGAPPHVPWLFSGGQAFVTDISASALACAPSTVAASSAHESCSSYTVCHDSSTDVPGPPVAWAQRHLSPGIRQMLEATPAAMVHAAGAAEDTTSATTSEVQLAYAPEPSASPTATTTSSSTQVPLVAHAGVRRGRGDMSEDTASITHAVNHGDDPAGRLTRRSRLAKDRQRPPSRPVGAPRYRIHVPIPPSLVVDTRSASVTAGAVGAYHRGRRHAAGSGDDSEQSSVSTPATQHSTPAHVEPSGRGHLAFYCVSQDLVVCGDNSNTTPPNGVLTTPSELRGAFALSVVPRHRHRHRVVQ